MPIYPQQNPPYYEFGTGGGGGTGSFAAVMLQSGTGAPTIDKELNNTIGEITWARVGAGVYTGTCTGAFGDDKTGGIVNIIGGSGFGDIQGYGANQVIIHTYDLNGDAADDILIATVIITVYS